MSRRSLKVLMTVVFTLLTAPLLSLNSEAIPTRSEEGPEIDLNAQIRTRSERVKKILLRGSIATLESSPLPEDYWDEVKITTAAPQPEEEEIQVESGQDHSITDSHNEGYQKSEDSTLSVSNDVLSGRRLSNFQKTITLTPGQSITNALREISGETLIKLLPGNYPAETAYFYLNGAGVKIEGDGAVIDGYGKSGYALELRPSGGGTVEATGITFKNASNGLLISGGYEYNTYGTKARGSGPSVRALVYRNTFRNIGQSYGAGGGYAAVHLQNTQGSVIHANTFTDIRNNTSPASLHGAYLVLSRDAVVSGNTFRNISGDPVRLRHLSDAEIFSNQSDGSGPHGFATTWFCDSNCAAKNNQSYECPSKMNVYGNSDNRAVHTVPVANARGC